MMSYAEIVDAGLSRDPVRREQGRRDFLRRLTSTRLVDRLNRIERDQLCRLYGEDPKRIRAMWLRAYRGMRRGVQ